MNRDTEEQDDGSEKNSYAIASPHLRSNIPLNRRSQSVREGYLGSKFNRAFSRARSLNKVLDISFLNIDGAAGVDVRKLEIGLKSCRSRKIHDIGNLANSGLPDSEEVGETAPSSGSFKEFTGDAANGDGAGNVVDQVPDQSPIEEVALIVPITDDPSLPVWTFRTCTLGILSCTLVTFINTYFSFRSEPIALGVTSALVLAFPLGRFMAANLPDKSIRVPGTKWGFSLNPGEFNPKEQALIVIFSSAGALRLGGVYVIALVKIYLRGKMDVLPAFIFLVTTELMGLSWGGLLFKFLVEPASMWWPSSLVNVSLINALHKEETVRGEMSRLQFFLVCLIAGFCYHVIPGYLFPTMGGISVVCYLFKHNTLAQQIGSGNAGLGVGAVSFDYATIISFLGTPFVVPYKAVFNMIVGFCFHTYVMIPIVYWRDNYKTQNFPLFSARLFTAAGTSYNVTNILSSDKEDEFTFNSAGYETEGPTYFSAFYAVNTGYTFTLFGCIISQLLIFHGGALWRTIKSMVTMKPEPSDVHTHLMKKYPQVPTRWYLWFLIGLHVMACTNLAVYPEQLEMKWWGVFLGDAVVAILTVPICILVATTNQLPNLAIMAQYFIGYIRPGQPVTSGVFRTYSTVVSGRVANYLVNFKLGNYMKIPPRAVLLAQAIGSVVATVVAQGVTWWLYSSIDNICDTDKLPASTPWTCPADRVFFDQAITWGLVGPKRLFDIGGIYNSLNYYFIPGVLLPVVVWLLRYAFPRHTWITLINAPLLVKGAWAMPPSAVVNNTSWLLIALIFSFYVFRYKKQWWQKYNYVLSAALDTGTVLMALLLYYAMNEDKKRLHWWGERENRDHCPLAACPVGLKTGAPSGCHGY